MGLKKLFKSVERVARPFMPALVATLPGGGTIAPILAAASKVKTSVRQARRGYVDAEQRVDVERVDVDEDHHHRAAKEILHRTSSYGHSLGEAQRDVMLGWGYNQQTFLPVLTQLGRIIGGYAVGKVAERVIGRDEEEDEYYDDVGDDDGEYYDDDDYDDDEWEDDE